MTLLSYQIFHTVSQQGSFARAAELLHLTPSAISHAVAGMEQEIGFSLFVRTKSGVTLTAAGQSIEAAVERVLSSHETVLQQVAQLNGMQKGTVSLGVFNSVCVTWLPRILTQFKAKFPAIEVNVYQGGYDDILGWLKNGIIDFGFMSAASSSEAKFLPLKQDPLVCVVPKGFVTRRPGVITLDELRRQNFVIQGTGVAADVQMYLKKYQLQIHSTCHVTDDQSQIALVESGLGICIIPKMLLSSFSFDVEVLDIDPPGTRTVGLALLSESGMSPAARQMIEHIKTVVQ